MSKIKVRAHKGDLWRWKAYRAVVRVWDFFRYDIHQGLRNLWLFFPVVWRWRGWDFSYDYVVFMRAIELHRRTLLKYHSSAEWKRDVMGMDLTLKRWDLYLDPNTDHLMAFIEKHGQPMEWSREVTIGCMDDELRVWDLMHDHLKRNARGWWD